MCSGSSTGAIFSTEEYNPNHVRTAPSDDIQGPLLGNLILEDGYTDVAVVWAVTNTVSGSGEAVAAASQRPAETWSCSRRTTRT